MTEDAEDAAADDAAPDVEVDAPVKIDEMMSVLRWHAHREEGSQTALVEGGYRTDWCPQARRRIKVLDQTALFLERIKMNDKEIKKILTRRKF